MCIFFLHSESEEDFASIFSTNATFSSNPPTCFYHYSALNVRRIDQCYGETIPVVCNPGDMVQVTEAHYRQTQECTGGFHSNFCSKKEPSNPACVGNQTCIFNTPWIYLSPECGYSNNFLISYKCVPSKFIESSLLKATYRDTKI